MVLKFFGKKLFGQKNVRLKIELSCQQKFQSTKIFVQKNVSIKKFSVTKFFRSKKFFGQSSPDAVHKRFDVGLMLNEPECCLLLSISTCPEGG